MADDSNDTQAKIDEEDRDLQAKERQLDPSSQDRDGFADAGSGDPGDTGAKGEFAHQGDAVMGGAMGGGPDGTGNTGAELPGGAVSEFARTTGGHTHGRRGGRSLRRALRAARRAPVRSCRST